MIVVDVRFFIKLELTWGPCKDFEVKISRQTNNFVCANPKILSATTYIVAKVSSQPKLFRSRRRIASLFGAHGSVADQDKGRRLFNKPVGIVALGVSDTTSNYRRFFPCYVSSPASKSNLSFLIEQIFSHAAAQFLPSGIAVLGIYGTMFIFAVCCFAGAIFIIIYVPETKNKSMEQIQEIMAKWVPGRSHFAVKNYR